MRILLIDTTKTESTNVALILGKQFIALKRTSRAQHLQEMIKEVLKKAKITLSDLGLIAVLTGPGSFTGTRMGVVTANTLNWLKNIPITEVPGSDFDEALDQLRSSAKQKITKQAKARY